MNTYEAIAQAMALATWDGPDALRVQALAPETWMLLAVTAANKLRMIDEMTTLAHSLRNAPHLDPAIKALVARWDRLGCAAVYSPEEMTQLRAAGRDSPPF